MDQWDYLVLCPHCGTDFDESQTESLYGFCDGCENSTCLKCGQMYHGSICEDLESLMADFSLEDIPDDQLNIYLNAAFGDETVPGVVEVQEPPAIVQHSQESETGGGTASPTFNCTICLEDEVKLENGIHYGCKHYYCKECIKTHLKTYINDRNTELYDCPFEGCSQKADYNIIKSIIDAQTFEAFDNLLLDKLVENEPEIVKCPKCAKRLYPEPAFAYCEECKYQFCTGCSQDFHGVIPCGLSEEEKNRFVREMAAAARAEDEERIQRDVTARKQREDHASEGLIRNVCKQCPSCKANIEKNEGCNHMQCSKCNAHFCWICMRVIRDRDPYEHFNRNCKLFDYE